VRAGIVRRPRDYKWSSYRAHALGAADPLVAEHPLYRALGRSKAERQAEYRALFRGGLDDGFVEALRRATNGGWALGDARFKQAIAEALGRRVAPLPLGRKAKPRDDERQIGLLSR
jgi:putative transposase